MLVLRREVEVLVLRWRGDAVVAGLRRMLISDRDLEDRYSEGTGLEDKELYWDSRYPAMMTVVRFRAPVLLRRHTLPLLSWATVYHTAVFRFRVADAACKVDWHGVVLDAE